MRVTPILRTELMQLQIGCTRFGPRVRGCCSNASNSSLDNEQLGLHQPAMPYAPYMIRIVLA